MMNAIQTDLQVLVERDVPVPVRDGTLLSADVYHRRSAGPWPVIVERSPYHQPERVEVDADLFVRNGYVYVFQHVRGRFRSRGAFRPLRDDGWGTNQDGFDTIAWAARQPWSNGAVAMFGGSYAGYTQYLAAPTRPPALRALLIRQGPSDLYGDLVYRGGAHQLFVTREWGLRAILLQQLEHETAALGSEPRREAAQVAYQQLDDWFRRLPLRSFPPFEGAATGTLSGWTILRTGPTGKTSTQHPN